jgi:hypothetical protein
MIDFARRSLGLVRAGLIVLLVALIAGPGYGQVPGPDAWENRPPDGLQGCKVIDSALIVPVPVAHRPEAIAKLENVAITELDQGQVLAVLDRRPPSRRRTRPSDASISAVSRIKAQARRRATICA